MSYIEKLKEYEKDMIQTLQELVQIPSVQSEPREGMPFGEQVDHAYRYLMELAERDGFETQDVDHYGGHIQFGGKIYDEQGEVKEIGMETMGILGHLDVVPVGDGWIDGDPFSGVIRDGKLYGRGTSDDKGPVVAAYYAMKAIRDAGFEPEKKVRLILGLDEETGWKGMEQYLKKAGTVDFGFTPDGDFPVIHGELGMLVFEIAKKFNKTTNKGLVLRTVTGGSAPNVVPDTARAVVRGESYTELKEKLDVFRKETGYSVTAKGRGKSLELCATGLSAHGANPEKGLNAISVLMAFLGQLNFAGEDINETITFYNEHIGFQLHGESIGCACSDELSGKLIWNMGMVKVDEEAARFVINVRYPLTCTEEQVYDGIKPVIEPYNMGIVKLSSMAPLHVSKDEQLVQVLMEIYQRHTGDLETKPLVIGGGTYAKAIPNTVAYGMLFPGEPDTMHQKNECISLESFKLASRIYADAIVALADGKKIPQLSMQKE